MTYRRPIFFLSYALTAISLISCRENELEEPGSGQCIDFHIEESPASMGTRAEGGSDNGFRFEVGGHDIDLSFAEEPYTKAAELNDISNPISNIYVTAIEHENYRYYFKDIVVNISNGTGESGHFWPKQNLSFFAYASSIEGTAPQPVFERESSEYKGSFSYSLPSPTSSPQKDASAQPDIVFAITPDQSSGSGQAVDLEFHHALSALIFKTGNMPEDVYLKSITISNVYSSGNCSLKASGKKDVIFTWDYTGQEQSGTYTEEINETAVVGDQMGDIESTFMMLPQAMSDQTELSLSFSIEGREYTMVKKFKEIIAAWEADKKYVFTIGLPDEIGIDVEDNVEGLVKSNVTIQNTGIATGYIRAAIVGYWLNAKGQIETAWSESDGTFTWGGTWDTYWVKGADGYYYHRSPVKYQDFTHPLFEKYELNEDVKNSRLNMTLELSIVVQIIPEDALSVWPEEVL